VQCPHSASHHPETSESGECARRPFVILVQVCSLPPPKWINNLISFFSIGCMREVAKHLTTSSCSPHVRDPSSLDSGPCDPMDTLGNSCITPRHFPGSATVSSGPPPSISLTSYRDDQLSGIHKAYAMRCHGRRLTCHSGQIPSNLISPPTSHLLPTSGIWPLLSRKPDTCLMPFILLQLRLPGSPDYCHLTASDSPCECHDRYINDIWINNGENRLYRVRDRSHSNPAFILG
jgi:hypothetical protein